MDAFSHMLDSFFSDPNMSSVAFYREGGNGTQKKIRILKRSPDRIASFSDGRFVKEVTIFEVKKSDAPYFGQGDTLEIDGVLFEIVSEPNYDVNRKILTATGRVYES